MYAATARGTIYCQISQQNMPHTNMHYSGKEGGTTAIAAFGHLSTITIALDYTAIYIHANMQRQRSRGGIC